MNLLTLDLLMSSSSCDLGVATRLGTAVYLEAGRVIRGRVCLGGNGKQTRQ